MEDSYQCCYEEASSDQVKEHEVEIKASDDKNDHKIKASAKAINVNCRLPQVDDDLIKLRKLTKRQVQSVSPDQLSLLGEEADESESESESDSEHDDQLEPLRSLDISQEPSEPDVLSDDELMRQVRLRLRAKIAEHKYQSTCSACEIAADRAMDKWKLGTGYLALVRVYKCKQHLKQ